MKQHRIEIRRMVKAVEFSTIDVDDETLKNIESKTISREALNDLLWDAESDIEIVDGDYPHEVAIIRNPPTFVLFEDD